MVGAGETVRHAVTGVTHSVEMSLTRGLRGARREVSTKLQSDITELQNIRVTHMLLLSQSQPLMAVTSKVPLVISVGRLGPFCDVVTLNMTIISHGGGSGLLCCSKYSKSLQLFEYFF